MQRQVKNGAHHAGCAAALAFAAAIALVPRQGGAVTTYAFSPGYSGDHVHFSDPLNYYTKVAPPSNIFDSRLRLFLSGKYAEPVAKPLKWQIDMDCFRYLEIGRLGVSEPFLRFSPNLQNSEPPSSESKGGRLPHK